MSSVTVPPSTVVNVIVAVLAGVADEVAVVAVVVEDVAPGAVDAAGADGFSGGSAAVLSCEAARIGGEAVPALPVRAEVRARHGPHSAQVAHDE
ncbi:hypothetical protein DVH05_005108 [Phytophthora capsici]|nr:hypothetical protein DVH05_005108 [Phytophthora capsici]